MPQFYHPFTRSDFAGLYNRQKLNRELVAGSYSVVCRGHQQQGENAFRAVFEADPTQADISACMVIVRAHGDPKPQPNPIMDTAIPVQCYESGGKWYLQATDGSLRELTTKPA